MAGIIGKYAEYPFDLVKVRLQSQPSVGPLRYNGPLDCFKQSIRQDGFLSLYRGISAPLVGAAIETSCLFFSVCFPTNPEPHFDLYLIPNVVSFGAKRYASNPLR